MNMLDYFDTLPLARAVGWTLLHFVWQGALIALVFRLLMEVMRERSANARYAACCVGMGLMIVAPLVTLVLKVDSLGQPLPPLPADLAVLDLETVSLWDWFTPALPWLTLFWFSGTIVLQGRLLLLWMNTQRLRRRGTRPAPHALRRTVAELCALLEIKKRVRVFKSSVTRVPMVMGWLSPVILVPGSVLSGLSPREIKMVLAHELAHIRRHDYIVNLVQALFETLLFYHPAVWWLSNRLRIEREYCCDDVAVSACRDALSYARALSSLDALRDDERLPVMASTGGSLMNRIIRLLNVRTKPACRLGGWLAPLVLVAIMAAAVSAMTLSPASALEDGDVKTEKAAKKIDKAAAKEKLKKKGYYVEDACLEDATDLIKKMKEAGKSKDDIQRALLVQGIMGKETKKDLKKRAQYEEGLVKKMKADGKSDKEIKQYLSDVRKKDEMSRKKWAMKIDESVKAMQKKGMSPEEISQEFKKMRKKEEAAKLAEKKKIEAEKRMVTEMKAKGMSDEEIKKKIKAIRIKEKQAEVEKLRIEKMKKMGMSDEKIKRMIEAIRKKENGVAKEDSAKKPDAE